MIQPGSINQYIPSANADKNIYQTKSTENVINSNDTNFDNVFDTKRKVHKTLSNTRISFPKTPAPIKDRKDGNGAEKFLKRKVQKMSPLQKVT